MLYYQLLISFGLGFISGILLSILAIIVGKKFETKINEPLVIGKAEIIKRRSVIDEITNENN